MNESIPPELIERMREKRRYKGKKLNEPIPAQPPAHKEGMSFTENSEPTRTKSVSLPSASTPNAGLPCGYLAERQALGPRKELKFASIVWGSFWGVLMALIAFSMICIAVVPLFLNAIEGRINATLERQVPRIELIESAQTGFSDMRMDSQQ